MILSLGNWILEVRRRELPLVIVRREKQLTETELDAAFAVSETNKLYVAVQQLLQTAEDNSHQATGVAINQTNQLCAHTGAAEICAALQRDMASRRRRALPALRLVKPRGRGPYERLDLEES